MLLSSLLKNNGITITPKIRGLIDNFGDRLIPEQFKEDFMERTDHLLDQHIVGFTPIDSLRKGHYESTTLDRIFSYTSEDFAKKFPKFEVLFLKIWCLIHTSYSKERLPTTNDLRAALDSNCVEGEMITAFKNIYLLSNAEYLVGSRESFFFIIAMLLSEKPWYSLAENIKYEIFDGIKPIIHKTH